MNKDFIDRAIRAVSCNVYGAAVVLSGLFILLFIGGVF